LGGAGTGERAAGKPCLSSRFRMVTLPSEGTFNFRVLVFMRRLRNQVGCHNIGIRSFLGDDQDL
jgi:hypothetical protein